MDSLPSQFKKDKKMLVFHPSSNDVKEAFERTQKLGVLPNSFTRGQGRMTGFLGEVAFELLYPNSEYVGDSCFTYDYVMGRRKIDVKSKTCIGKPLPHYTASVNTKDKKLNATTYFFVRVRKDLTRVWLLGWASKQKMETKAEFKKRGEKDEFGFTYKVDGYHLPIKHLRRPDSL